MRKYLGNPVGDKAYNLVQLADNIVSRKVPRGDVVFISIPQGVVEIRADRVNIKAPYMKRRGRNFESIHWSIVTGAQSDYRYEADNFEYYENRRFLSFEEWAQGHKELEVFMSILMQAVEDLKVYDAYEDRVAANTNVREDLIKLGSDNKSLRKHIRPVLAELKK